jgi:predicted PurR-regulated permease PerM
MHSAPTPSASTQPKSIALILASSVVIVWGLIEAKGFIIPVIVAALLALMLMPLIRIMKRARIPETAAVCLATLVLILPFIGLASVVVTESQKLVTEWPTIKASAQSGYNSLATNQYVSRYHLADKLSLNDLFAKVGERASEGVTVAITSLGVLFHVGSNIGLVLFFAVMMLFARGHIRQGFERILAAKNSYRGPAVLDASVEVLEQFLAARLLIILFVAVADFVILAAAGVPYAVVLALLQGVMTLVPVFGFVVGLIPVAIVAAAYQFSAFGIVGLLVGLWAISSFQDHFMAPKLIGQKLNLNFFITYLALFAGEKMWGIWGMFLAIPILGVIRVVLNASEEYQAWGQLIQEREVSAQPLADETQAQQRLDLVTDSARQ